MPKTAANGITIEYEIRGSESGSPLLLINGLGTQLISWTEALLGGLVESGFRVIIYDNRDSGLSTDFDEFGPADIPAAFKAARSKQPVNAPYNLDDMADDAAELLNALNIPAAHIVGSSNGGAIAQIFAYRHKSKTLSLASIMATSGRRGLPRPTEAATAWLNKPRKRKANREDFIAEALDSAETIGSPGFRRNEAAIRIRAGTLYDRAYKPGGHGRQLLASIASADSRVSHLEEIKAPTVVIHGADDPLVPVGCGEDVKNSIAGATMTVIPGMAHDYPDEAVPTIVAAIRKNADRASKQKPD
jgi:pimeloyl-ACP methyl ester carboxylesterase